ncbi:MAG: T9SS type A sorting domain-containing protein, partial [Bacteroidota bacterium]
FKGYGQTTAAAKAQGVGANVTVRGVVINGSELGIIRYIQDNTGGIAAYGSPCAILNKGDSVVISGPLTEFYNLYEISPPVVNVISNNGKLFAPEVVTPATFGEAHEGKLIKILNCTFNATGNFSTTATNYTVTSNSQTFAVRSNTLLAGTPIPTGTVNIIGVGSQFCGPQSSSGCTTGYQLLPRTTADFVLPSVTGLNEFTQILTLNVFPNPSSNTIHFTTNNEEPTAFVYITDILGHCVYTSEENVSSVDIGAMPKGIYLIHLRSKNNIYQGKFIKE